MKTALEVLLGEGLVSQFIESFKKGEPFVAHGGPERFAPLTNNVPFLNSLDDLLNTWPDLIQAHLPDVRDEASSIDTTPKDARKLFQNGMGLLFDEAQRFSPVLQEWLENLRRELQFSAMTISRSICYATPDGKGTAPHFDQNTNFVVQLHGTKIWSMARNTTIENPLTRHTMGLDPDMEMQGYLDKEMPIQMPREVQQVELKPGSVLFVPRGYWHSTEAEGDALALNFTFTPPTWIDLFTVALRSRLSLSSEWRATAIMNENSEGEFDNLLTEIIQDLPHWKARDILSAIEPE